MILRKHQQDVISGQRAEIKRLLDIVAAQKSLCLAAAIEDIAAERKRQIEIKGWSPSHDDQIHGQGDLAYAAAAYAIGRRAVSGQCRAGHHANVTIWPWDIADCHMRGNRRRDLVKAGALIVAEIERIDREVSRQSEDG